MWLVTVAYLVHLLEGKLGALMTTVLTETSSIRLHPREYSISSVKPYDQLLWSFQLLLPFLLKAQLPTSHDIISVRTDRHCWSFSHFYDFSHYRWGGEGVKSRLKNYLNYLVSWQKPDPHRRAAAPCPTPVPHALTQTAAAAQEVLDAPGTQKSRS